MAVLVLVRLTIDRRRVKGHKINPGRLEINYRISTMKKMASTLHLPVRYKIRIQYRLFKSGWRDTKHGPKPWTIPARHLKA